MNDIRHALCSVAFLLLAAPPVFSAGTESPLPASVEVAADAIDQDELHDRVVFQVLLAEIALQRGDLDLAAKIYADLSLLARDAKILERSIEVSSAARRLDLALETARLWVDVEPSSDKARKTLVGALIAADRLDETAPYLARMLDADKTALPENLIGLNRLFIRNADRNAVFRLVDRLAAPYTGIAEAHYAVGVAAVAAGMHERALAETKRSLDLRPDWELAAIFHGQLLLRKSPAEGIAFLESFVVRYPAAHDVQLQLARALVSEQRYAEAGKHFERLLVDFPDNPEVVYSSAVLAFQQGDRALAEARLKHFITLKVADKSAAHFFLAQIAEEDKRFDEALEHYAQVVSGNQYLSAVARQGRLLARLGRLDEARAVLAGAKTDKAEERAQLAIVEAGLLREAGRTEEALQVLDKQLAEQPDQPELLYESSLLAEKLRRFELMEKRLRRLIVLQPNDAQAYNALGYTYADRNERLPEARQLIERALALAPEDGFILDSMGWVLFRQGDLAGALSHLERAYAKRKDAEIAAHLAEVLWQLGRRDDADRLLAEARQKHPDNEALAETAARLKR